MNNKNNTENSGVPLGLGMAFAQNADAMRCFSSLSPAEQQSVINSARSVRSKKEMQLLVSKLAEKS